METLIVLLAAALFFYLCWLGIGLLSRLPAKLPGSAAAVPVIQTILYILLVLVGLWWLWTRFLA